MKPNKSTISERVNAIQLTFTESERSNYPVSRLENGKICLLDKSSPLSQKVKAGETWECKIIISEKNVVIIVPIEMIHGRNHNESVFNQKLSELQKKFSHE